MARRKLKDLNLLDDFLFGTMLTYPDIGEKFIREILQIIFGKKFGKLDVKPQKVYYGSDTDMHGARLDVYLEEPDKDAPGGATVYDVESDRNMDRESIADLPKRTRFYHALIDAKSLKSGQSYHSLKNVVVIIITPYDPFGMDQMVYTIKRGCLELPALSYDDGACTLYLYTKGTKGNPPEEIRQLLRYMENTTEENATNTALQHIDQMVRRVKADGEVSLEYMKIFEREEMLVRKGQELERRNTERERQNAEREKMRADAAEKELERLKEELNGLKRERS